MQSGPLAAPGLYPVADAPEVFQGDTAAEPLRLGHYPFGDPVVDIPLVSPLPSGDLPELAPRRPRAPLLQASAPVDVDPPFFFHRLTAVGLRLAVREQVHRPQVAAQVILHGGGGRDVHLHHLMQDELAPPIAQHRLMATGQPGLRAGGKRDPKAIHRHRAVALVPMLVDGDRPASPKGGLVLSALFVAVRVGDLADDHDSCCRGDLKPLPYLPISAALEGQPVPEAFTERDAGQPVRRRIEPLEPGDQLGGVRRVQTDSLNLVHQYIISIFSPVDRGNCIGQGTIAYYPSNGARRKQASSAPRGGLQRPKAACQVFPRLYLAAEDCGLRKAGTRRGRCGSPARPTTSGPLAWVTSPIPTEGRHT